MADIEANKAIVREFIEAMSRADVEAILEAYAEDGYVRTMGDTPISGVYDRERIADYAGSVYDTFPEGLEFTVHGMTAEGDRVAVEAESNGAHVSGRHYRNFYHFLFTLRDGKVASLKEYLDTQKVMEVLVAGAA